LRAPGAGLSLSPAGRSTSSTIGLSAAEALGRLARDGPNSLPVQRGGGAFAIAGQVLREPMFLLLIAAAAIYFALGDLREAIALAFSVVLIAVITIVQERRTERALERLRVLATPRALVVRDGAPVRIPGAEVVAGDLLVIGEGDRIAADARLNSSAGLLLDESLATGESAPVAKTLGGDERLLAGTLVVKGSARAEVIATGMRSELGRIGASLATLESGKTRLERETSGVVRVMAAAGLGVCILVALLYTITRGDALAGILAGVTLAMALLPEEFPVVLTIFLALGAWRISRHGVLTRRLPAIETLGAATVLCCDKTGTLTENRMRVARTWCDGLWRDLDAPVGEAAPLLAAAALACESDPFDPMERAILATTERMAPLPSHPPLASTIERRYPMGPGFLATAHGRLHISGRRYLALKGAPETVIPMCGMAGEASIRAMHAAADAAAKGLRVLAVAEAMTDGEWRDDPDGYEWRFAGLIGLEDPVRSSVPGAVALCRRAGIRVVMITGDHPATAREIAVQAGIDGHQLLTGPEVAAMDDAQLTRSVEHTGVFARVRPEHKLRIVQALQRAGHIVAMTGDGVNDAPAVKAADIGIAMGRRGTDVAREAAALVLLEDDFGSIVATVRLGRRIYDNIRNAMRYLVAVHVPLAGMGFIPIAAGWPVFLLPLHVVFLEFIIDPACSIVFEAERTDAAVMERPPRPIDERLFTRATLGLAVLLGTSVLLAVTLIYGWASATGYGPDIARTMAFTALVAGNIALIFANRSHHFTVLEMATRQNGALWWVVGVAAAALCTAVYVPPAAGLLRMVPLPAGQFIAALALGLSSVLWYDFYKLVRRREGLDPVRS
jgi:Ca2+-transporting ATPase